MIKSLLVIIFAYIMLAGIMNVGGFCPAYINYMPTVIGPGQTYESPSRWWHIFCPFMQKVY